MHPILRDRKRLAYYLLAWIPVALLLMVLTAPRPLSWVESAAIVIPICLIYAFVCLSSFYMCRAAPLGKSRMAQLARIHLVHAAIGGGMWFVGAKAIGMVIGAQPENVNRAIPLLFSVGVLLYLLSVALHWAFLEMEASRSAQQREAEAKILAGEAELRALKAQINPHFLYNSLNSISALTGIEPLRARDMCNQLSEFLRSTLGLSAADRVPLAHEIQLVRRYLDIERTRFGSRLRVEEEIASGCLQARMPALLLQPLVENAVVHGIANMVEGGFLRIEAKETADGDLSIVVENSVDEDLLVAGKEGFGLSSVKRRLQTVYGPRAGFSAGAENGHFRVAIRLPFVAEKS